LTPDQVKLKTIILVLAVSPLRLEQQQIGSESGKCVSRATCPSTDCCFSGLAINWEYIVWNQLIGNALYGTDHMGRSCMEPKNWECTVWNQSILKILFEIKELSLILNRSN
jgi:hypothetical protein